jgi:tetratricopeptide (TPR) repeat protein
MRRRALASGVLLLLAAAPAWAVKEWYDHYADARNLIARGRYAEALKSLQEARRIKPNSGLAEQTYGLDFVHYLPYYYEGLCHLKLGDYDSAIRSFNIEEQKGAIRKNALYRELIHLREEANAAIRQNVARLAREEAGRLVRESQEHERQKRYEDALVSLAKAHKIAETLGDSPMQRQVAESVQRIRAASAQQSESAARAQRIEAALADGRRLLEEGRPSDASVRFDDVLALDPRNARALEGRKEAQERILSSTTRQAREMAFKEGKALFEAARYEESLRPLAHAAADPGNAEARAYLEKAQRILQGTRREKDRRVTIDRLLAEGERLLLAKKFPEAQVAFESVLEIDDTNVKARERVGVAETQVGEAIFARYFPNQSPTLNFYEPSLDPVVLGSGTAALDVEGPAMPVVGLAADDRGIARIEFRIGGRLVAEKLPDPAAEYGPESRNLRFEHRFPLEEGPNELTVAALDTLDLRREVSFRVTRHLRFYETKAFLPSALASALGLVGIGLGVQRARRRRALRNRFNPYIAGAPVLDDGMFFGRQKLMTRMMNVLHHNSLMITGERRIGKTTFLYHLKKTLAADEGTDYRFFPVFSDLQGVVESSFFHALMADVVDTLQLSPATLEALRFRSGQDKYDGRDFSHDLQRVIEELKTRTSKKVKLALLIDEVDVLNEYSERINQRLRSIFMKTFSESLVAIMSGVGIKRIWNSEGSPWYNFFDEIELQAFTREEAEALVRTPVTGYFRFEPEAVERILEYSQLKPYLVQKFCIHAVNRMLEDGRMVISAADVESVREAVQFEGRQEPHAAPVDERAFA